MRAVSGLGVMIFEFESDFAGSLRCIPMIVRQKLDLAGIKMTLRQWSQVSRDDRAVLTVLGCEDDAAQRDYRARVLGLIAERCDEPPRFLEACGLEDWQDARTMPEIVRQQAASDGIAAPSAAQWAALDPLQRFALVKLSRSKHDNENFVPAMREFGLLADGA